MGGGSHEVRWAKVSGLAGSRCRLQSWSSDVWSQASLETECHCVVYTRDFKSHHHLLGHVLCLIASSSPRLYPQLLWDILHKNCHLESPIYSRLELMGAIPLTWGQALQFVRSPLAGLCQLCYLSGPEDITV